MHWTDFVAPVLAADLRPVKKKTDKYIIIHTVVNSYSLNCAMLWNAWDISTALVLSLACILMNQHGVRGGKQILKTPGNGISETLNFKMSLVASALKNLCLWCELQSHLLFIISLPLKNFLTALQMQILRFFYFKDDF